MTKSPKTQKKVFALINKKLMPKHQGRIIAIEPESGKYFLGDSEIDAYKNAIKSYPGKMFIFKRVGFKTTHFVGAF